TTTVAPTDGTATVAGCDVVTDPLGARRASAVVFQETVVDRSLTGRRNLEIHARLWGVDGPDVAARVTDVARRFGLADLIDRPVSTYSGGQRRRLEIARSLVSRPRVLFLDEPTVGLDPRIRFELLDLIGGLRAADDMTIVLTTHYLDEAERLCDRVAVVHEGVIVALDTPRALLEGLGDEIVELRIDGDAVAPTVRAQCPHATGDPGPAPDADPVRRRDRAGPRQVDDEDRCRLPQLRRGRHHRVVGAAQLRARRDRDDRRPRERRAARPS